MLRSTGGEFPEFIAAVSVMLLLAPDDACSEWMFIAVGLFAGNAQAAQAWACSCSR